MPALEKKQTLVRYDSNRRLYDLTQNAHVTNDDVRDRVMGGEQVFTRPSALDVTAEVLAGLIMDDVRRGCGATAEQLRRFIRSYLT